MRLGMPFLAAAGAVVFFACSGSNTGLGTGSGPGTGTATSRSEPDYCSARSAAISACAADGGATTPGSDVDCGETYRCAVATLASPDAFFACRVNSDCNAKKGFDYCLSRAAEGRNSSVVDKCTNKLLECKAAKAKNFDDDTCGQLPAFKDDALSKLAACLDKPCEQISECFDVTYKAFSPDC